MTFQRRHFEIRTVAEYEALIADYTQPESELVLGCGPRTSWHEAKKLGVIEELSEWSRENSVTADILVTPELADAILGVVEVQPSDRWDFYLGKGKDRKYYHFQNNQRNRKFAESGIGTPRKGMLHDAVNRWFVWGPQAVIDCYAGGMTIQHRVLMVKLMQSKGIEDPSIWLNVTVGIHPALASRFDIPRTHKPKDNWFKTDRFFQLDLVQSNREYLPDIFDLRGYQTDRIAEMLTVFTNLWGRITHDSWTASFHPSGSQAPTEDETEELADRIDLLALQSAIVRIDEACKNESGKKRLWVNYFSTPMIVTAACLASNSERDATQDIVTDPDIVNTIVNALAETADSGDAGFSLLVADIVRNDQGGTKRGKGTKMESRDKRVFDGLISSVKALLADEPMPENPVPNVKTLEKLKAKKAGWSIFGGIDQPPANEAHDD